MNPSYQHYATHDESEYPELWDGCVGAWAPCLGPSGTRLHDNSGRANWGTLTSMDAATDWVVSDGRYALDLDGSNDWISTPFIRPQSLDVSIWLKTNDFANKSFLGDVETDAVEFFARWRQSNEIQFGAANLPVIFVVPSQTAGTWAHVVLRIISGVSLSLWFNGSFIATGASAGVIPISSTLSIGARRAGTLQNFNGCIDDCRVYGGGSLSDSSIKLLWSRGNGRAIAYTPRRRRKAYFLGPSFNAAWARGSNQFIQPSMIGVA